VVQYDDVLQNKNYNLNEISDQLTSKLMHELNLTFLICFFPTSDKYISDIFVFFIRKSIKERKMRRR